MIIKFVLNAVYELNEVLASLVSLYQTQPAYCPVEAEYTRFV